MRTPAPWVVGALAALSTWAGATLDVLAISGAGDQAALLVSSAESAGLVVTLIVVLRIHVEDRSNGMAAALDASALGTAGRVLGRCSGSALAGGTAALVPILIFLVFHKYIGHASHISLYVALYLAASLLTALFLLAALAALLARFLPPAAALIAGAGLALLPRVSDHPLLAVLPRPVDAGDSAVPWGPVGQAVAAMGVVWLAAAAAPETSAE
jgi:hypothetical protein